MKSKNKNITLQEQSRLVVPKDEFENYREYDYWSNEKVSVIVRGKKLVKGDIVTVKTHEELLEDGWVEHETHYVYKTENTGVSLPKLQISNLLGEQVTIWKRYGRTYKIKENKNIFLEEELLKPSSILQRELSRINKELKI